MTSDEQAIANVLSRYAELIDAGDFAGLGALFFQGCVRFDGSAQVVSGAADVAAMYASVVQLHGESPRTKHVMTNTWITVAPDGKAATSRSYYSVLQAHQDLGLQVVAAGRYADRLVKEDGTWRFVERLIFRDLVGDLRFHLRVDPYQAVAG